VIGGRSGASVALAADGDARLADARRGAVALLLLLAGCGARPPDPTVTPPTLTVALTGDVFPDAAPFDTAWIRTLRAADFAVINLEGALTTEPPLPCPAHLARARCVRFVGPPAFAHALVAAGVRVVGLANNHALDAGATGLTETLDTLAAAGLNVAGAGPDPWAPRTVEMAGLRLAVFAAGTVRAHGVPVRALAEHTAHAPLHTVAERLAPAVRAATPTHDAVLVWIHAGREGADAPSAAQRTLAEQLATAGATIVAFHGAHRWQGFERRGGALIAWNLGDGHRPGRPGPILTVTLSRTGVVAARADLELDDGVSR
jgi:poly-gamma-glutamate capsule biosynthesis protein CapA/YwtB (metallophosphatase superfamily)